MSVIDVSIGFCRFESPPAHGICRVTPVFYGLDTSTNLVIKPFSFSGPRNPSSAARSSNFRQKRCKELLRPKISLGWISAQKHKNGRSIFGRYWTSSLILIKDPNARRSE
jgi:hypothetical protein